MQPNPVEKQEDPDQDPSSTSPIQPLPAFLLAAASAALTTFLLTHLRRRPPAPPISTPAIAALTRLWLSQDPDPLTRAQVSQWLEVHLKAPHLPHPRLPHALDPTNRLVFGTAGVRAECAPGYDRINALTLLAVVQAVCSILPPTDALIVVGHDARLHSRKFAVLIADICLTQKARVCLFSRPVPTPLVAFAARRMEACVAFCVTASHNPPLDNGLKIFWNDAIQIRPRVAERIERAIPECARPYKVYALTEQDFTPGHLTDPYDDMSDAYVENMASLRLRTLSQNAAAPQVVYTACHGVGYQLVCHLFKAFGLQSPIACVQQCNPDPTFPTLPFPNPEEKGALDLALATARQEGVKIVLANDPDADRLGAAELQHDGTARVFTGDEIAVLLTDYLVSMCGESDYSKLAVVGSTVSSKMIDCMAKKRGFLFREALTGFKWLNKEAVQLEEQGYTVLLTYEEAIGYNVSRNLVRDKDGVSAAAVFAEMAGYIYEKKSTIARRLQQLLVECGQHISHNGYLRLSDASPSTTAIFDAARLAGLPSSFGVAHVMSVRDLTNGSDTAEKDGLSRLPADSKSQFLTFRCAKNPNDHLVCPLILHLRGSGTEPKIKFYAELRCTREEVQDGAADSFLKSVVQDAIAKVLKPEKNCLVQH